MGSRSIVQTLTRIPSKDSRSDKGGALFETFYVILLITKKTPFGVGIPFSRWFVEFVFDDNGNVLLRLKRFCFVFYS